MEACRILGRRLQRRIPPATLLATVYSGRISAPRRNSSGHYEWLPDDLDRAAGVLPGARWAHKRAPMAAAAEAAAAT